MKFNLIEGGSFDADSIYDDFVNDYVYSNRLSNEEIRCKYNLTHKEFKELSSMIKEDFGLNRRNTIKSTGKYYYKHRDGFIIAKSICGVFVYIGFVKSESLAIKLVELCKKVHWNVDVCKDIVRRYNKYAI